MQSVTSIQPTVASGYVQQRYHVQITCLPNTASSHCCGEAALILLTDCFTQNTRPAKANLLVPASSCCCLVTTKTAPHNPSTAVGVYSAGKADDNMTHPRPPPPNPPPQSQKVVFVLVPHTPHYPKTTTPRRLPPKNGHPKEHPKNDNTPRKLYG